MPRCFRIAACLVLLALVPTPADAADGTGLESALELLDQLDALRVDATFDRRPISEVIEALRRESGVSLSADWDALRGLGIRPRDPVTLELRPSPMSTVLSALILTIGDEFARPVYEVHAGVVVITAIEATEPMRLTDVYDVRDILTDDTTIRELRGGDAAPAEPAGATADAADTPTAPERISPGMERIHMVVEHVDPEAWIDFGGARSRITERDGVLMVSAGPRTHRRLRDALTRLRSANPMGVRLRASMVDLPSELWTKLLGRYPAGSRALARAVLRQTSGSTTWRTTLSGAFDTPIQAETVGADDAVHLTVTPKKGADGIIELDLDAGSRVGETRHVIRTTIALAPSLGAVVLEMPVSGAMGESRRLLVLLPDRF